MSDMSRDLLPELKGHLGQAISSQIQAVQIEHVGIRVHLVVQTASRSWSYRLEPDEFEEDACGYGHVPARDPDQSVHCLLRHGDLPRICDRAGLLRMGGRHNG